MKNIKTHFAIDDRNLFEAKMLNWLKRFNIFCFLNNNGFLQPDSFPCFVAAGADSEIFLKRDESPFRKLQEFHDSHPSWLFGHFNYELNTGLKQDGRATIPFPDGYFFSPQTLFSITKNEIVFLKCTGDPSSTFSDIMNSSAELNSAGEISSIRSRISKEEYLNALENVKQHIKLGDCYELNFCQEFLAEVETEPAALYHRLNNFSPQPFSAYYRNSNSYCCCASPERFLRKTGRQLLSQPIKGTAPRGEDAAKDKENFLSLKNSAKDKSENVMVVDLVRNDLSRVCKPGTVHVPELFAIKSFPGVHQMVSSVTGEMEDDIPFSKALEVAFPMGSMTGAPKVRVMELIDEYESSARGLFSGSIGYITPDGDFDFNVVIRSLFINTEDKALSFMAGGGITHYSNEEAEYDESILKTAAIRKVLNIKD